MEVRGKGRASAQRNGRDFTPARVACSGNCTAGLGGEAGPATLVNEGTSGESRREVIDRTQTRGARDDRERLA